MLDRWWWVFLSTYWQGVSSNRMIPLQVDFDAELWGVTAREYISFTLDWWSTDDGDEAWPVGTSLATVQETLLSSRLEMLARGIGPSFVRVGGSKTDTIHYYLFDNATTTAKLAAFCKERPYRCLTPDKWDIILNFVQKVNARLVFCLNYLGHTTRWGGRINGRGDQSDWAEYEAKDLLQYTAKWLQQNNQTNLLYGLELGNEVTHRGKAQNLTRYRLAYQTLRSLIVDIWPHPPDRPRLMGPAATGTNTLEPLAEALSGILDIFTYHKYHARGGTNSILAHEASQPGFFSHPGHFRLHTQPVARHMGTQMPLWVGEGALAYNSGRANVTDAWLSSLWYANTLGVLALTRPVSHSVHCRQSLLGGNYALIDYANDRLEPNPDYWIAYVWKRIVGVGAIGPLQSPFPLSWHPKDPKLRRELAWSCCDEDPFNSTLRIHAFCAKPGEQVMPGDIALVIVHLSSDDALTINWNTSRRSEFILTGKSHYSPLASRQVLLNGNLLQAMEGRGLPDIWSLSVTDLPHQPVRIPQFSVSFVVLHDVQLESCRKLYSAKNIQTPETYPAESEWIRDERPWLLSQLLFQICGVVSVVCWICIKRDKPWRRKD